MMLNINEKEIAKKMQEGYNDIFSKWDAFDAEMEKTRPPESKKETVKIPKKFDYDKRNNAVINTMTLNGTTY